MERILLYYPTIDFPNKDWLRHALLYTDKVSSILPYKDESKYPELIKYLHYKGEYKPIHIEDIISSNTHEYMSFAERFIKDLDCNPRIQVARSRTVRENVVDALFRNKFSQEILIALEERRLISNKSSEMVELPENIAIYYMSILSQFVSRVIEDDALIPSTDYIRFRNLSIESPMDNVNAMNLILSNCLPVPSKNVELSDIINFKQKHKQDLLKFRHTFTSTQSDLNNARDIVDLREGLLVVKEKIDIELAELDKLYSKNRMSVVYSSLNSLLSMESPKLFNSMLGAGMITTAIDPKVGIGIGTILLGAKIISDFRRKPNSSSPYNYLFEAKNSGIIGNDFSFLSKTKLSY